MLAFLLFAAVFSTLIFTGYRVNMYLYARGAFGTAARARSVTIDTLPIQQAQQMAKRERDDGLRYARFYLAFLLGLGAVLVIVALSALGSVFH